MSAPVPIRLGNVGWISPGRLLREEAAMRPAICMGVAASLMLVPLGPGPASHEPNPKRKRAPMSPRPRRRGRMRGLSLLLLLFDGNSEGLLDLRQ